MSNQVENSFVKQFERDAHLEFQRQGSKLMNTVRRKGPITGSSTTFQKIGSATAGSKTRDGLVPVTKQSHTPIECVLQDRYCGEWVDKLDELKLYHDEYGALTKSQAWALGRQADKFITDVLDAQTWTNRVYDGSSAGLTRNGVLEAIEYLGDAPDDGQRFGLVGTHEWSQLMTISEFASGDYVGDNYPWLANFETRKWATVIWIKHTGLTVSSGNRLCYIWHKDAIGFAYGQEIKTDMQYYADHAATFVGSNMSMGACMIDITGAAQLKIDADIALAT